MYGLKPKGIVEFLDKYIIGQNSAKRSVAIALRNRWRRQKVEGPIKKEILPNNILMIGPTGVGKTEISRRLAELADAPFLKVEASRFTEIGYVGKDVESMVRNLVDIAVNMTKEEKAQEVKVKAQGLALENILDILLPPPPEATDDEEQGQRNQRWERTREKLQKRLEKGEMDSKMIEIDVPRNKVSSVEIFSPMGMEEMGFNISEFLGETLSQGKKTEKVTVEDAKKILMEREIDNLIDMEKVVEKAKERVENSGIIFIDEIDKIADKGEHQGPSVSRQGVQRDILPLVEGAAVRTKYGIIRTDHVLFIAAGAFHDSKPSDLIPELQGRFPIRVELDSLDAADFKKILTEPENALVTQYQALLEPEEVILSFTKGAVTEIARLAYEINSTTENIGARRLQTVLSTLLEDIMFDAPYGDKKKIKIDKNMVTQRLKDIVSDPDLTRFIL